MKYYYVTRPTPRSGHKLTLEDVLFDLISDREYYRLNSKKRDNTPTRTYCYEHRIINSSSSQLQRVIDADLQQMRDFYERYKECDIMFDRQYNYEVQFEIENRIKKEMWKVNNYDEVELKRRTLQELENRGLKYNELYYSFFIPKHSGGLRRIDAPSEDLKSIQSLLKAMFETFMSGNTYHTSAFAYMPGRCATDVGRKMQQNKCRWILKTDFSDFFGSITLDFAMQQLAHIYPFCEYIALDRDAVRNCLKFCFLNGKLPQGTPISPLLTNILMIPLDFQISTALYNYATDITTFDKADEEQNFRLIYTRYADDINIGAHRGFDPKPVLDYIKKIIREENAPFIIKPEKTRYCSNAGQNWILGVMLNQDNQITVGHKRKKQIKAMLSNFAMDYRNGKAWDPSDIHQVLGNISYLDSIEKDYSKQLVGNLNSKFEMDILQTMKNVAYGNGGK